MHQRRTPLYSKNGYKILWGFILLATLTNCALPTKAVPTLIPTDTPTPLPTLTPTPTVPLVMLVLPVEMDMDLSNLYQKTVYDLAQGAGYRYQVRNTLTTADLEPALKIVIVLPPDPGMSELAAAAPQAQFLAVNIPGLAAGGNLSVLGESSQPDIPAFTAGYISAMITDDYHTGILIPKDDTDAQKALTAFTNGMEFYCGLCNPFFYVSWEYPQYVEIPTDEDPARYGAYADFLILQRKVRTVYLYPSIATPDLLAYLDSTGILMISPIDPQQQLRSWVASIRPDVLNAIQTAWLDLLAGNGGKNVASLLSLTNVNSELLTPGKQRLAEQVLDDLQAGFIASGVNP